MYFISAKRLVITLVSEIKNYVIQYGARLPFTTMFNTRRSHAYNKNNPTTNEIYIRNSNRFISNNESKLPNPLITVERPKVNSTKALFDHPSLIESRSLWPPTNYWHEN